MTVSEESLTLDGKVREAQDAIFGSIRVCGSWIPVDYIQEASLGDIKSWGKSTQHTYAINESVENPTAGWIARTVWGFEDIGGQRYHTRRVMVTKGAETKKARLVYDFEPL